MCTVEQQTVMINGYHFVYVEGTASTSQEVYTRAEAKANSEYWKRHSIRRPVKKIACNH